MDNDAGSFRRVKSGFREGKMGAWDYGVFDDDDALDALCELKKARRWAAVDAERCFGEAIRAEYIGYETGRTPLSRRRSPTPS